MFCAISGPPSRIQAGGHHRDRRGRLLAIVLEVVRKVGVEGDAVARGKVVTGALDEERQVAVEDHGGLAAARLVHGRVRGPPVAAPGASVWTETSARWPGSGGVSSSKRCPPRSELAAFAGAADRDVLALVQAQQLRERQLQPGGDFLGHGQGRAGLAALDLREHRRADAGALGQVAQREAHRVAQGLDTRADGRPHGAAVQLRRDAGRAFGGCAGHRSRTLSRTLVL